MIKVREKFLRGDPVPECEICWNQERNGKESMRMRRNQRYLGHTEADPKDLALFAEHIDSCDLIQGLNLSVGNQCQLRCITCNPSYSRNIKKDYDKLGWTIHHKTRFDSSKTSDLNHHLTDKNLQEIKNLTANLKWISLVGGEPTLDLRLQSYLEWCIDQGHHQHLSLVITTNGVNVKQRFLDLIGQFQKVILTVSVDGYGELDEYLRWPGRWDKKIEFIDICQNTFQDFDIHSVVYGMNCLALDKLVDFVHQRGLKHNLECLQWPRSLSIDNLPHHLKSICLERLNRSLETIEQNLHRYRNRQHGLHTSNSVRAVISQLENTGTPELWPETQSLIDAYDSIRPKKLSELVPELG